MHDVLIAAAEPCVQELLPVLGGGLRREEARGAGQGRPALRHHHLRRRPQPRRAGRRLRLPAAARRKHNALLLASILGVVGASGGSAQLERRF